MKKWSISICRSRVKRRLGRFMPRARGGVDVGRDAFSGIGVQNSSYIKKILKKLYFPGPKHKEVLERTYAGERQRSGLGKTVIQLSCVLVIGALFFGGGGVGLVKGMLGKIDYFKIAVITVRGCRLSSVDQVRASSGVKVSTSLFGVDGSAVSEAVRRENGWVKEVRIQRRWPDGLVIEVAEYEPYALLAVGTGEQASLHYLDRNGVPFIKVDSGMDLDYPVISGLETADKQELAIRLRQPLSFLQLVSVNNPNLPAQSISEIHLDPEEGVIVYLVENPFPIFFGMGDIRKKYLRLRKVLQILYKPRKTGMEIARVAFIRMDYLKDKVIVGYTEQG